MTIIRSLLVSLLALGVAGAAGAQVAPGTAQGEQLIINPQTQGDLNQSAVAWIHGLGARSAGQDLIGMNGDALVRGVLGTSDIPSVFTRRDLAETINQAWLFSAGVAGPFRVSGGSGADAAIGSDNVRCHISAGTPRCTFEDAGFPQWTIDNSVGTLRMYRTNSSGTADQVSLSLSDNVTLAPKGGSLLPALPYGVNIGSHGLPVGAIYTGELWAESFVAQETIATIGGEIVVAPTTSLIEGITSTQTTIKTKHNNLSNGSHVLLKRDFRLEAIDITSNASPINKCTNNCDADSTTNWTGAGGTLSLDRNVRFQGDASVLWTQTTGSTRSIFHASTGDTSASTQYTMSLYIRRSDAAPIVPSATDYLLICGDGSVLVQMTATDAGTGSGWYRLSATCTTSGSDIDVIGVTAVPTGFNYNIDAAQIETGATLTPWLKFSSSYTVTRNVDGTGGNAWDADTPVVDTTLSFLDIYSTHGLKSGSEIGPTIVGNVRLSSTWNNWAPRWACGQMNGLYGYVTSTFGCAFGDSTATWMAMDAVNGFRVMNGSTVKADFDISGNITLGGHVANTPVMLLTPTALQFCIYGGACTFTVDGTTGDMRGGSATALNTGTGYFIGGTGTARFGNPSTDFWRWDGTNLTVKSLNLTIDSSGVRIAGATAGLFDQGRAFNFDYGDSLPHGMYAVNASQLNVGSSTNGVARVQLMAENTSGADTLLQLNSQNGGLAANLSLTTGTMVFTLSAGLTMNGNTGQTKTCTVLPTVVNGIVTSC